MSKKDVATISFTRSAAKVCDIDKNDINSFIQFWNNGELDTIFVTAADFLSWKGVNVRSPDHPRAWAAKDWSYSYREIAAKEYEDVCELVMKKSAMGFLLFDVKFMVENFNGAKDMNVDRSLSYTPK